MPLPSSRDCLSNTIPNYLNFFKLVTNEFKNKNIIFLDILKDIKKLNKNEILSLFFEGDGHFTRHGHKLVAKSVLKKLDKNNLSL